MWQARRLLHVVRPVDFDGAVAGKDAACMNLTFYRPVKKVKLKLNPTKYLSVSYPNHHRVISLVGLTLMIIASSSPSFLVKFTLQKGCLV
jgi:hypothetical protein